MCDCSDLLRFGQVVCWVSERPLVGFLSEPSFAYILPPIPPSPLQISIIHFVIPSNAPLSAFLPYVLPVGVSECEWGWVSE